MSGPVWAQILVFFAVAIPVVALATHAVAWVSGQVTGWYHVRLLGRPKPYASREEWRNDLMGAAPLDDVLERARGGVPGRDDAPKKKELEMPAADFIKLVEATLLSISPSYRLKLLDGVKNDLDGMKDETRVIGRAFRRKDTGRIVVLKQAGDGWGRFDDGCRHAYSDLELALPKEGEVWERLFCQKHGCFVPTGNVALREDVQMKEWWYDPARIQDVRCGCLRFCGRWKVVVDKL